jgi:superfamily II DNA/RNA helicase
MTTTTDAVATRDGLAFTALGVPRAMAAALARRGIVEPFPIQSATIADALAGRDVCGRAPTGSGKTIAFGLPLALRTGKAKPHRPRSLVLVPTRELASQVTEELRLLLPRSPEDRRARSVQAFYGGVGFDGQLSALRRGVDIAVACPGRLADLVQRRDCDLRDVDFVVVDEADRMSDMGFLPEVRRLLDACHPTRQTLLFSATLDGQVDVLIRRYQQDPVRHEQKPDGDAAQRARHLFWAVDRPSRLATTAAVVDRAGPTVVFCRTKRGVDRVARQLRTAGVSAAAIHGDRSQSQRERALAAFQHGRISALVATDVAARGIHVDGVACVVHFDLPGEAKDYVHRSGRTARAGASGTVVSLVPAERRTDLGTLQRELGYPTGVTSTDLESIGGARQQEPDRSRQPHDVRSQREPHSPGKRRPSGAARRKAKRLDVAHTDDRGGAPAPSRGRRSTSKTAGARGSARSNRRGGRASSAARGSRRRRS